ncbi:MAG: sulfatase [Verrucomicrobiota bacterium]|nr:sulfatase [Verrucomicrobiota bacterium]
MNSLNSIFLFGLFASAFSIHGTEKLNVVFILADDMSRDTWGAYGGKDCKTPNIDQLAKDGIRFDRAYCTVAMCAPFRQELYSGRSPWRTGTLPNHSKSVAGTKSIVHYLKPLGYRVALLGKSHVGPNECYPFERLGDVSKRVDANPETLDKAKAFLDDCKKTENPFCLFIGSHDSHAPFTTGDPSVYDPKNIKVPTYWIDTPELREVMIQYYAEITNFDRLVGMMRKELEKRNLWKNTIFMVCSEQGTQLPFAKWTCYDNGLHTGLVAHWPNRLKPGSVIKELISTADITPSLVDELGGKLKDNSVDGKSFIELLKGNNETLHDYVYGAFTNFRIIDNRERIYPIRSIRNKRYSLIYNPNYESKTSNVTLTKALKMIEDAKTKPKELNPTGSWVAKASKSKNEQALVHKLHNREEFELYDLQKDPFEMENVAYDIKYQKIQRKLKNALLAKLKALGDSDPISTEKGFVSNGPKKGKKN